MLGSINTETARDAWATVPGRVVQITNNANGDPTKETFINQGVTVFARYYTYDNDGNVIEIECKEN